MADDDDLAGTAPTPSESILAMTGMIPAATVERVPTEIVDVCICTFQRQTLLETLTSLSTQTGLEGGVRVIVADNDDAQSALAQVERGRTLGLNIHYVHAPARNISLARNACLDAARAPFLAFIDDDEVADPEWLAQLLTVMDDPEVTAAFGPVAALYPNAAPEWLRKADLHSTRPVVTRRGVETGYTSNAIVRRAAVGGLRFDLALGRSGGEDTDFFTRLHDAGHVFREAPDARVTEKAAPNRMALGWLMKRSFRSGQTHARRYLGSGTIRAGAIVVTAVKFACCVVLIPIGALGKGGWQGALVRAALHAGAVMRLLGRREVEIYGR